MNSKGDFLSYSGTSSAKKEKMTTIITIETLDYNKSGEGGIFVVMLKSTFITLKHRFLWQIDFSQISLIKYYQLIGSNPFAIKYSFVRLKGLLPKKPLSAAKGEGCADFIMKCF